MPALAPSLRALARNMGVEADAAIAEGWLSACDCARRNKEPTANVGWIIAAVRRALRREWVGPAVDPDSVIAGDIQNAWGVAEVLDPFAALVAKSRDPSDALPKLGPVRQAALAMVRRAQASESARTRRYWLARAWAMLAKAGGPETP
jgi:hypothetical protein